MASVLLCQVSALTEPLRHLLWMIYGVGATFVGILTLFLVQYCRRKRIKDVGEESLLLLPPSLPALDGLGEEGEGEMSEDTQHSSASGGGGVGTVYRMDGTGGRLGGRGRGRGRGRSVGRGLPVGRGEGGASGGWGSSSGSSSGGSGWGINWGGSGGSNSVVGGGTSSIRGRRIAPTTSAQDSPHASSHPNLDPNSSSSSFSSPSDIEMVEGGGGGVGVVSITYNPLGPYSTISTPSPRSSAKPS